MEKSGYQKSLDKQSKSVWLLFEVLVEHWQLKNSDYGLQINIFLWLVNDDSL